MVGTPITGALQSANQLPIPIRSCSRRFAAAAATEARQITADGELKPGGRLI
jgi:hypothetical protein